MALSIADRKHEMPHGALQRVARRKGVSNAYVTAVMNGTCKPKSIEAKRKLRTVQVALARELKKALRQVFAPDEVPEIARQAA